MQQKRLLAQKIKDKVVPCLPHARKFLCIWIHTCIEVCPRRLFDSKWVSETTSAFISRRAQESCYSSRKPDQRLSISDRIWPHTLSKRCTYSLFCKYQDSLGIITKIFVNGLILQVKNFQCFMMICLIWRLIIHLLMRWSSTKNVTNLVTSNLSYLDFLLASDIW